jgi:hypothetical protein
MKKLMLRVLDVVVDALSTPVPDTHLSGLDAPIRWQHRA